MILRGSLESPKISRVGFETVDISKGCVGSADAVSAAGAEPAADGAGSGETVACGVGKADAEAVKHSFEVSEVSGRCSDRDKGRTLMISLIFSSLKSLRINLSSDMVSSFKVFIIIIIFFKDFLSSFKLK